MEVKDKPRVEAILQEISALKQKNIELEKENVDLKELITTLEEELNLLRKQKFGDKSPAIKELLLNGNSKQRLEAIGLIRKKKLRAEKANLKKKQSKQMKKLVKVQKFSK